MKTFFDTLRYGSPSFLYISSLFILINIFGTLCNGIISVFSFIIFSFLVIYYFSKKNLTNKTNNLKPDVSSLLQIVATLFSVLYESAYVTNVFNYISDESSGKSDRIFFSIIIILFSLTVSLYGKETVSKISNIIFILPIIVIIPCLLSLVNNSITLSQITKADNPGSEVLKGFITAMIFTADFPFVTNFTAKRKRHIKLLYKGSYIGIILTTAFGILSALLFGKELFKNLKAPLFSASATVGVLKFEEIMLIIFSICLLYRFACKILYIQNFMKDFFNTKMLHSFITVIISCISAIFGVLFLDFQNILFFSYLYGLINLVSFLIIPSILQLYKKEKSICN